MTLGVCGAAAAFSGDTYLRLYGPSGAEVASNDDSRGLGSQISYTVPTTGTYTLRMGCYNSGNCSGTVVWNVP
ncbi:PPC domain-containing protein [Archangium violaceum]|uniref:PPC domain-containing protein n=1 Tax=Archangium violaceum TaxID=83451 RepID=UPI00193B9FBD|nr:PPC domain-containing protein [Archangium violaceum]QRK04734.1 PPC domain-containing protein [Archangium violaceum]